MLSSLLSRLGALRWYGLLEIKNHCNLIYHEFIRAGNELDMLEGSHLQRSMDSLWLRKLSKKHWKNSLVLFFFCHVFSIYSSQLYRQSLFIHSITIYVSIFFSSYSHIIIFCFFAVCFCSISRVRHLIRVSYLRYLSGIRIYPQTNSPYIL